jgi:hypothetical protein
MVNTLTANNINNQRFDNGVVSSAEITDEGYLRAQAIVTKTGVFKYANPDGTVRRELRHPNDVFQNDSLCSLKMKPVTNGHPDEKLVASENAKQLSIGYTGESISTDGKYIVSSLLVTDKEGVEAIKTGTKRELSLGYTVDLVREDGTYDGEEYDHRQTNIRYNHLAIVERGRAGAEAKISFDSVNADELVSSESYIINNDNQPNEDSNMAEDKFAVVTLDGLEYKASPEVAKAYEKANAKLTEANAKLDSVSSELETLKAERDSLSEKLDAAAKEDHSAKIKEAVKARASLIDNAKKLCNDISDEIDLYESEGVEIMKKVVGKKCPQANLDSASEVYVQARFDTLLEDYKEDDSAIAKQRELAAPKLDGTKQESVEDARDRMIRRMKEGNKK